MPFRKPASGLCPEPRRGRNRRLRPICAHWRAPRGAARRSQPRIIAALTRLLSASRWVLISSVQRCARSCSANRLGASRTSTCRDLIERVFAFANASCAQPASRTLAHFCQVCASCDVGLGAGLWHSAPEALSAGQEGFGSCQPPCERAARLEQRPLKLLNIFAEAGSVFCWHRWRVIQVSPRSAYEKCMRCGRHRHVNAPEGGSARPTGRRSRLFPPF